jgi:hypothetical protein
MKNNSYKTHYKMNSNKHIYIANRQTGNYNDLSHLFGLLLLFLKKISKNTL